MQGTNVQSKNPHLLKMWVPEVGAAQIFPNHQGSQRTGFSKIRKTGAQLLCASADISDC